jgi:hypothetical protein
LSHRHHSSRVNANAPRITTHPRRHHPLQVRPIESRRCPNRCTGAQTRATPQRARKDRPPKQKRRHQRPSRSVSPPRQQPATPRPPGLTPRACRLNRTPRVSEAGIAHHRGAIPTTATTRPRPRPRRTHPSHLPPLPCHQQPQAVLARHSTPVQERPPNTGRRTTGV